LEYGKLLAGGNQKMIIVDYETLTVEGDFKGRFNSKEELFKSIRAYVKMVGNEIPDQDNRSYIFKGRTNEGVKP
jgi:hypothetical protein